MNGMEPIIVETVLTKLSVINVNKFAGPDGIFSQVLYEAKDVFGMRPDSLLRLWHYINHLLTYLLTYLSC